MTKTGRSDLQPIFGTLEWGVCPFSAIEASLLPVRSKGRLPANAKSVIVVAFPYLLEEEIYKNSRLSRFAVPADYHIVCGEILQQCCEHLQQAFRQ